MKIQKRNKLNTQGFAHVELIVIIVVILGIIIGGATLYQRQAAQKYKANMTAAYPPQVKDMEAVYKSFKLPVFTNNNTTDANDAKNLATVNSLIATAKTATVHLQSQNKVDILPVMTVIPSIKTASNSQKSFAHYINDTDAFLNNYQKLSNYISQLEIIQQNQMANSFAALQAVGTSTPANLVSSLQSATTSFDKTISALKTLQPTSDLAPVNSNLITDFSNINNDLKYMTSSLQSSNLAGVASANVKLGQDSQTLQTLANENITAKLQTNSQISNQVKALIAEMPKN